MSTEALSQQLGLTDKTSPVLVDTRSAEEYAVSHLPGALHAPTPERVLAAGLRKNQPIVAYCSVGYRSSRLAEKLQTEGFEHVQNLEGSLFQWANEGRPLVSDGIPVDAVHPYDRLWGLLLEQSPRGARKPEG